MTHGGVLDASWIAPAAVALLTVLAARRTGAAWWSAWVAGVVTWIGLAAVTLRVAVTADPAATAALSSTVEGLAWAVSTVAVIAAFALAAGGPTTSPIAAVAVTTTGLVATAFEPSAAVVLPGLVIGLVASAGERYRGAVTAAIASTGVVLVGGWAALVAAGRLAWPGGPTVDPGAQGPIALMAVPGLLTIVTSVLAVQLAERPDPHGRRDRAATTYRPRRTLP
ncbi:MAG: hypothetical protein ACFCUP_01785 [Actinomycetales bacterium]